MDTFKVLKTIKGVIALNPCQKSSLDFDISVEIGFYQHQGNPLTQKQLLLLGIASNSTVRRHIKRLIESGMVVKQLTQQDHRAIHFTLSDEAIKRFKDCLIQLKHLLSS